MLVVESEQLLAEADGEDLHPDAVAARHPIVAVLMNENDHRKDDQERNDIGRQLLDQVHTGTFDWLGFHASKTIQPRKGVTASSSIIS